MLLGIQSRYTVSVVSRGEVRTLIREIVNFSKFQEPLTPVSRFHYFDECSKYAE